MALSNSGDVAITACCSPIYRGRFAPSPTGPLHFGSLVSAVGSFLQARSQQGEWLVRIEDIDTPRVVKGAADQILYTLECYGLFWDAEVCCQQTRIDAYEAIIETLHQQKVLYNCTCSRRTIKQLAQEAGLPLNVYPGTCRTRLKPVQPPYAMRVIAPNRMIALNDGVQGLYQQNLAKEAGDFVVRRMDNLFAYQLAVVADDAQQGVTEIIRGADLLDAAPRQIYLQELLGFPRPTYAHLPIAVDQAGDKLSKQTHAAPLDMRNPLPALWRSLVFLGQQPPSDLLHTDLTSFWRWAISNWRLKNVPRKRKIAISI